MSILFAIASIALFIVLPILFELVYIIYSLIDGTFEIWSLIIFVIYLVSAILINFKAEKILKKKILVPVFYIILPVASLALMTIKTNGWYKAYDRKKSTATVYLYNESSSEKIRRITSKSDIPDTMIDKYYDLIWSKSNNKWMSLEKNERAVLRIRPGVTSFEIETEKDGSKKYLVDLNMSDIDVADGDEIFLCYGGKNFFQFIPDTKARKAIIEGTFTGTISLPEGAPSSKKEETK